MYKPKKTQIYQLLSLLLVFAYIFHFSSEKSNFDYAITSDSEAYYAYLPAIYLFGDNTFQTNEKVKLKNTGQKDYYVVTTENGKHVNKFFSGVSFLATPAFLAITGVMKITGYQADGYSDTYFIGMFVYSIFLLFLGLIFFQKAVSTHFQLTSKQKWIFPVILVATPWLFTAIYGILWANNYLFVCFAVLLWLIVKMITNPEKSSYVLIFFFVTGIVAITRPTSLIFLVMVLFFFDDFKSFLEHLKQYVLKPKVLVSGILLFLIPIMYQLGIWKWQTGSFILWSYSGEGFNWLNPQFFEVLFSYRTGILFHSPILIFCLAYCLFKFRKNRFKATIYLIYFVLLCYVSGAWWCPDFETRFGLRNFNEHYVFLLLPLFDFVKEAKKKKWIIVGFVATVILPFIRFNQYVFGYNQNQRFTQESYWKSLAFWNPDNKGRWVFYHSTQPFGKRLSSKTLFDEKSVFISPEVEYYLGKSIPVNLKAHERIYIKVSYDRVFRGMNNRPPDFVIDMYNRADKTKRVYSALPGFEDSHKEVEHVEIMNASFDYSKSMDEITIFFWNLNHVQGELKNVKVVIEKYGR